MEMEFFYRPMRSEFVCSQLRDNLEVISVAMKDDKSKIGIFSASGEKYVVSRNS